MNRRAAVLAIIIVASAALYLIGNESVPLFDRDEPRYAQTSRQMLQSGDWVVPHYLDMVRTAKPVFIYWCQAATMDAIGDNAFAARLPSTAATLALLIVLSLALWRAIGPQRTVWTVFILATSGMVIAEAKFCITDAVHMLWVTIAQMGLFCLWRGNWSWKAVIVTSLATALAGLTKGPVVLGFLGMTVIALGVMRGLDRLLAKAATASPDSPGEGEGYSSEANATLSSSLSLRAEGNAQRSTLNVEVVLKILVGIGIVAVVVSPWMILVNHRASEFLRTAVGHEIWARMMTPLESHTGPPGYYLITIWITFFPWSIMLPPTIGLAIRHRGDPQIRFALAATVGPWILLECVRTKLVHYLLPVFPPLAFLAADALVRCLSGECDDLKSRGFVRAIGTWAIILSAVASVPWILVGKYSPLPWGAMTALSIAGPAMGLMVFHFFRRRRVAAGAMAMGIGTMALMGIMFGWYLPEARFLQISPQVAKILIDHGVTQPNQVIMLDYMEPSLAFYQGGTIREAGPIGLGPSFISQFPPWMVVSQDAWRQTSDEIRGLFVIVASVRGMDYADRLKWKTVLVLHRKSSSDSSTGR